MMAKRTWHIVSIIGRGYIETGGGYVETGDSHYYILTRSLDRAKRYTSQRDAVLAAQRVYILDPNARAVALRVSIEEVGSFPHKTRRKR